ncbi:Nucleotide-binding, alpha-beta plait [Corchorus olitorius]|uniref:Nucleotide-binding, alpha-beta plait n=1 Tax=Corchorus olitorius TaxID=93759 RepID=A0A1R3JQ21_9ROSI|nr:Nucleotide-binding, alpha-beta plait [Corchorus olitorius]
MRREEENYGRIADVFIHRRGIHKGPTTFAFVRYWKEKEAVFALEKADFIFMEGIRIRVFKAKQTNRNSLSERCRVKVADSEVRNRKSKDVVVDGGSYKEVVCNVNNGAEQVKVVEAVPMSRVGR